MHLINANLRICTDKKWMHFIVCKLYLDFIHGSYINLVLNKMFHVHVQIPLNIRQDMCVDGDLEKRQYKMLRIVLNWRMHAVPKNFQI